MALSRFRCCQIAVIVTAIFLELLYIIRGVLLVYWYSSFSKLSVNITELLDPVEDEDSLGFEKARRAYYFTVTVLAIVSILRCIEYLPFFIGLWRYLKYLHGKTGDSKLFYKLPYKYYFIWAALITPVLTISLAIFAVGIANNKKAKYRVFTAYRCISFIGYVWSFLVTLGIVFTTLKIKEIWKHIPATVLNTGSGEQAKHKTLINTNDLEHVELHKRLTEKYKKVGNEVEKTAKIFHTWFLFPWITYFLVSSLKAKDILLPWRERDKEVELLPLLGFTLYNINQMAFLIISYMCAKKMNHYHRECVQRIQKEQLNPARGENFLAEQRKLLIQVNENYDFVPRVWGLGFEVKMNSFIYIIFLLTGLVFTILTPLF